MRRRRRRYGSFFEDTIIGIILSIVFKILLASFILLTLIFITYKLPHTYFIIVLNCVASTFIIYFTFISEKRPKGKGKIISCIVAASLWYILLTHTRGATLAHTAVIYLLVTYIIYSYIVKRQISSVLNGEALGLIVIYVPYFSKALYRDDFSSSIRFLIIPVILTVLSIPLVIWLTNIGIIRFDDDGPLVTLLLTMLFVFALSFSSIINLNYALDTSDAKPVAANIVERYEEHATRAGMDYFFVLDINGVEYTYQITWREYNKYAEGDEYRLALYSGAFGEPYYFPES